MNTRHIIRQLKAKYPGKSIIENINAKGITTEIICELDLTQDHPSWSRAIAVIDSSVIHYHQHIQETYKVLKGSLNIFKYDQSQNRYAEHHLKKGDSITIKPGEIHSNLGKETWVEVISKPGWVIEDFINLETLLKNIPNGNPTSPQNQCISQSPHPAFSHQAFTVSKASPIQLA